MLRRDLIKTVVAALCGSVTGLLGQSQAAQTPVPPSDAPPSGTPTVADTALETIRSWAPDPGTPEYEKLEALYWELVKEGKPHREYLGKRWVVTNKHHAPPGEAVAVYTGKEGERYVVELDKPSKDTPERDVVAGDRVYFTGELQLVAGYNAKLEPLDQILSIEHHYQPDNGGYWDTYYMGVVNGEVVYRRDTRLEDQA